MIEALNAFLIVCLVLMMAPYALLALGLLIEIIWIWVRRK